jgi:hypothetical protein
VLRGVVWVMLTVSAFWYEERWAGLDESDPDGLAVTLHYILIALTACPWPCCCHEKANAASA